MCLCMRLKLTVKKPSQGLLDECVRYKKNFFRYTYNKQIPKIFEFLTLSNIESVYIDYIYILIYIQIFSLVKDISEKYLKCVFK